MGACREGQEYALEIKTIAMEDAAKYSCKCNEISTTCTLTVEEKKYVYYFNQKLPKTAEVVRGKDLTLECSVSDPRAPVVWYHNALITSIWYPQYTAGKIELKRRENRCIMKIVRAKPEAAGEYCCMVEGDETYVDVAVEDPDWFFTRELKPQTALETDEVARFECEPITADDKYEMLTESRLKRVLKIKKIAMEDDAVYTCKVAKKTTSARLTVKPDVEFKQNLIDTNGIETKYKELVCKAYNPKKYPVRWFKNDQEITFDDRVCTQESDGVLYLIFKSLEMDDEAVYSCKIGSHQTSGKLGVSFPVPTLNILKDGNPLPEKINLRAVLRDGAVHIELDDADRVDAGNYSLRLSNEVGDVSIPLTLEVHSRPGPPKGPLDVCDLTATKCSLAWDPPEDDGGLPIKCYEVEVMDVTDGNWKPLKSVKETKCDVPNLIEGHKYKFRVRAVNAEGPSDYLETEKDTVARDICDPPDAPTNLEVVDYDVDHADLKWVKPRKENGAPIKHYIIESRKKPDSEWKKVKEVTETKASVPWKEDEVYEFRVMAVNKAGVSEPSVATTPMVAKHKLLKPFIDKSRIQVIKVKCGQQVEIDLRYRGEPDPEVVWSYANKTIEAGDEFKIELLRRETILRIPNAQRKHTQLYRLRVSNEAGFDEAVVEAVVLGKPSRPQGPLEVKDVTKNSAKLEWKPPADDGGEPIQYYLVEKKDVAKGRWEKVAEVSRGTTCEVPKLEEAHAYMFRVSAVSSQGSSEPLESEAETIAKNPYDEPDAPGKPQIVDHDKDRIDLKWEPPENDGGAPITGYHVERKEPRSNRWAKITTRPVAEPEYTDSSVRAGKEYEYRVIAINKAGPSPPSKPSDPVTAKPSKEAPKLDLKRLRDLLGPQNEIRLRAGEPLSIPIPITGAPKPVIAWTKDGGSVPQTAKITDTEELTGLDIPSTVRGDSGIYKIHLSNDYGEDEADIKVVVMDKPSPPRDLEVFDVFAEHCSLKWKPPLDDGGCPITDYIVEKCDESVGIWEPVTGIVRDEQVMVKGLQKDKPYLFRVKAVNRMGDSAPCETSTSVIAKNPFDPPGAPEDLEIPDYDHHSVTLSWKPPKSDGGNPIKGYRVEKRYPRGDWKVATPNLVPGTQVRLTNVDEGKTYEFRVCAVNDGGPGEYSKTTNPHLVKDKIFPPSPPESVIVDKVTKNGARLSWQKPKSDGGTPVTGYVVEKKNPDGDWVPVVETKEPTAFVPLQPGEEAQLRVRAVNAEGPGEPSRPTAVIVAEDRQEAPRIATKDDGLVDSPNSGIGGLKDVTLKAGQELRLPVAWFGNPTPTPTWTVNDKTIKSGDDNAILSQEALPKPASSDPNAVLEQSPGGTFVLCVPKARRVNSGQYQIKIMNDLGQVSSSCQVNVIDVPGPPTGPLDAVEVKADEITLEWKPPADDGGEPVTNYILEKRLKGSDSWQKVSAFLKTPTATVRGLEVGKDYEFRVMAENVMGVSEPLTTEKAIKAKHPFDPPSGMDKPNVDDTTESSVSLSWMPPRKGPVSGYIVEKRPKGEREWTKASTAPVTGTSYTVRGLPKDKEFQFRIVPFNLAGEGEPSEPTDVIKVQNPPSAPKISRDVPMTINAVVDQPFKMRIPYTGSPPDTVEVLKDGKPIPIPSGRFTVEITPEEVVITDLKAEREDTGAYAVALTNEQGKDQANIQVNVRGPPGAPVGPLEISKIKAESCSLSWNPPTDNGGSPVTNYVVEKQDVSSGIWTPVSSFVRQPEFDVTGLDEGRQYRFRVRAANEFGPGEPLEATQSITAANPIVAPGAPSDLEATDVDEDSVTLSWKKPRKDGGGKISGYVIEYKPFSGGDWTKAAGAGGKDTQGTVTGLTKGEKYLFRVSAKNEAGIGEPAQTNRAILCKPKYDAPDAPGTPNVDDVDKDHVDLSWTAPLKDGGARITGYAVEKRKLGTDDWVPATADGKPVSGTQARVENLDENEVYEFRVRAVNAAGPGEPSLPCDATRVAKKKVKPDSPEDVTVDDVMANSCTVKWNPPKSDGGAPITDYIVEKCDEALGIWEPVPGIARGNSLPVTGLTEGKRYLFRVTAVNPIGPSEPAETLTSTLAKNPFDTPDAPQSVKVVDYDRSSATITWTAPENDGGNPIKGYLVEKRTDKGDWVKATPDLVKETQAKIAGLPFGKEVEFRVAAVNDGGPGDYSRATQPQLIKDKTKKKNDDGEWEPVKQTTEPEAFVPMKEGQKAQFRVRAVNDEGEGEPSRPTPLITAEDQPTPPKIAQPSDGVIGGPGTGVGGLQDVIIKVNFFLKNGIIQCGWARAKASRRMVWSSAAYGQLGS
ncbi:unnamed protein product [Dibothriocephalus latus]|uniref:Twitchin n=1 Tax=Dibothriocephalus latus TaxID=60516 RepID=A0A3P6ULH0_DIBLA|nr:unnamed protein product [Dibothriocephalus latus]